MPQSTPSDSPLVPLPSIAHEHQVDHCRYCWIDETMRRARQGPPPPPTRPDDQRALVRLHAELVGLIAVDAETLAAAWDDGAEAGRRDESAGGWAPPSNPYRCHCGRPVTFGFDGDLTHHRGMCADCDAVRCDASPDECPHRGER
jgi:hypothetical protein